MRYRKICPSRQIPFRGLCASTRVELQLDSHCSALGTAGGRIVSACVGVCAVLGYWARATSAAGVGFGQSPPFAFVGLDRTVVGSGVDRVLIRKTV